MTERAAAKARKHAEIRAQSKIGADVLGEGLRDAVGPQIEHLTGFLVI